jgi:hypothetical protein
MDGFTGRKLKFTAAHPHHLRTLTGEMHLYPNAVRVKNVSLARTPGYSGLAGKLVNASPTSASACMSVIAAP